MCKINEEHSLLLRMKYPGLQKKLGLFIYAEFENTFDTLF